MLFRSPPCAIGIEAKSFSEFRAEELRLLIIELPAGAIAATMAAANKCLAKSNKADAGGKATKKRVSDKRRQHDPDHPLFMGRSALQLEGRNLDLDARRRGLNSRPD